MAHFPCLHVLFSQVSSTCHWTVVSFPLSLWLRLRRKPITPFLFARLFPRKLFTAFFFRKTKQFLFWSILQTTVSTYYHFQINNGPLSVKLLDSYSKKVSQKTSFFWSGFSKNQLLLKKSLMGFTLSLYECKKIKECSKLHSQPGRVTALSQ